MEPAVPADPVGPDLSFAWMLANSIDVRAFPAGDDQAAGLEQQPNGERR
ncbi:MAG: hypothetical protein ACRDNF_25650 [Streptosporangiaceae bacterium]